MVQATKGKLLMPSFTVSIWDRDNNPVIVPAGLTLTPTRFGAVAQGGNDSAEITVAGPELALHNLRSWLRYKVEITGDAGLVWEGHVDSIMLSLAGVSISVGTEQMYNAIKVLYSYTGDDGGSESGETDWGTDADSISEFGRKEAIHSSGGETTSEAATALRDTVLAGTKKASQPTLSVEGGTANTTGIKAGDVITHAGDTANKYVVNTGTGNNAEADIVIGSPGMRATLADTVEATVGDSYTPNVVFHRSALELAIRPYAQPLGGDSAVDALVVQDPWSGLVFEVRAYKGYGKAMFDVQCVYGVKAWKPDHIATLLG